MVRAAAAPLPWLLAAFLGSSPKPLPPTSSYAPCCMQTPRPKGLGAGGGKKVSRPSGAGPQQAAVAPGQRAPGRAAPQASSSAASGGRLKTSFEVYSMVMSNPLYDPHECTIVSGPHNFNCRTPTSPRISACHHCALRATGPGSRLLNSSPACSCFRIHCILLSCCNCCHAVRMAATNLSHSQPLHPN